jgi:ring-1,2-phenylacetyl-CoA epoxidase subunit PaaA
MTAATRPSAVQQLTRYAAATATCADRYAYAFYPMIRDGDEKFICCVHGGEDMEAYLKAAEVLRGFEVDLGDLVTRPISERGLDGADALAAKMSWTERAVFSAVFERALLILLQGFARSDHAPTAQMARSIIPREERHVAHGLTLLRTACSSADSRHEAQDAVVKLWPVALAVLGTEEARAALLDAARSELEPLGLSVGDWVS